MHFQGQLGIRRIIKGKAGLRNFERPTDLLARFAFSSRFDPALLSDNWNRFAPITDTSLRVRLKNVITRGMEVLIAVMLW